MSLAYEMQKLRQSGRPFSALQRFRAVVAENDPNPTAVDQAFRSHFFGMRFGADDVPCPLLEAAALESPNPISAVNKWIQCDELQAFWERRFPSDTPYGKRWESRRLVLSACDSNTKGDIVNQLFKAVELCSTTESGEKLPARPSNGEPRFLAELPDYWSDVMRNVEVHVNWQQQGRPQWDHPALLMVGETLAYVLNRGGLPSDGDAMVTWVLLDCSKEIDELGKCFEIPEGGLARLVIEKVPQGGGLLIPDCRYNGYLAMGELFAAGLRHVMNYLQSRSEWANFRGFEYDYRWRLIPLSPSQDGVSLPKQLRDIDGPSAEAAIACAVWAAVLGDRLDSQTAVSACFRNPGDSFDHRLATVGGIPAKILGLRSLADSSLEQDKGESLLLASALNHHLIQRVLLHQKNDEVVGPIDVGGATISIDRVSTFDEVYRELSAYCGLADMLKRAIVRSEQAWFAKECFGDDDNPTGDYLPNELRLRIGQSLGQQDSLPLEKDRWERFAHGEIAAALTFDSPTVPRANIVADSGIGKTTLLHYIAYRTAKHSGNRVPIRLENLTSLLESAKEQDLEAAIVLELTNLLEHETPQMKTNWKDDVAAWFSIARERGDVVWLLDALDQMTDHQRNLGTFVKLFPHCPMLLTTRREAESQSALDGSSLDLQPFSTDTAKKYLGKYADLFFERLPVADRGEPEEGHVLTIPLLLHLLKQMAVDANLDPLAPNLDLPEFKNRYTIYRAVMNGPKGLVAKGCRSLELRKDLRAANLENRRRALKCLKEIAWKQLDSEKPHFDTYVADELYERLGDHLDQLSNDAEDAFKQINVLTQLPAFDRENYGGLKWRHRSFLEYFAGCHLAGLDSETQGRIFHKWLHDPRWEWVIRFAFSAVASDPAYDTTIDEMAELLLSRGGAVLLWKIIDPKQDGIDISEKLETFCRWLVHRDWGSWEHRSDRQSYPWANRGETERPEVDEQIAKILNGMFHLDSEYCADTRDSRWLHPAWQLIVEHLPEENGPSSEPSPVERLCREIHERFLDEFENRVQRAVSRNSRNLGVHKSQWRDRGILELVPDEFLAEMGLISREDLFAIRNWPPREDGTYEMRRDAFNQQLKTANYCACPPVGWEHPYLDEDGRVRDPRECYIGEEEDRELYHLPAGFQMQRTPVTNLQFEMFDPSHRRERREDWKRDQNDMLDDHPVVEVSWFQAKMLCVWLTGNGRTFGRFDLPNEHAWEAGCRAGRDREGDEFGVPLRDQSGEPVLDEKAREQFHSMSSHAANFAGDHPFGPVKIQGPDENGTLPVGQFPGNGFGVVDLHGQVFEWCKNPYKNGIADDEDMSISSHIRRCLRGGSWLYDARNCRSSYRSNGGAVVRTLVIGLRLSRTL